MTVSGNLYSDKVETFQTSGFHWSHIFKFGSPICLHGLKKVPVKIASCLLWGSCHAHSWPLWSRVSQELQFPSWPKAQSLAYHSNPPTRQCVSTRTFHFGGCPAGSQSLTWFSPVSLPQVSQDTENQGAMCLWRDMSTLTGWLMEIKKRSHAECQVWRPQRREFESSPRSLKAPPPDPSLLIRDETKKLSWYNLMLTIIQSKALNVWCMQGPYISRMFSCTNATSFSSGIHSSPKPNF